MRKVGLTEALMGEIEKTFSAAECPVVRKIARSATFAIAIAQSESRQG
jgi:hypothetical protein